MSNDVFVGLDWAVHTHAVCVIDGTGAVLERLEVAHDRDGLAELMRRLARHGARLRIAIERPSGLIVDALVEAGHEVFPIHPNAVKASRPRYRSHGAKSDASDAYLLADLLRTDGHRWRALAPQSDDIRALRALVRSRDDLVAARVAAANQLTSTLQAFWPGAAVIFADVASPIALAFLRRYPSPSSAKRLSEAQLQRFCKAQHYSGRRSAAQLLGRLRAAASGHVGAHTEKALAEVVRAQLGVLLPIVAQIAGKRSGNPSSIVPLKLRTSCLGNQQTRRGEHGSTADGALPGAGGGVSGLGPEGQGLGRGQRCAAGDAGQLVRAFAALAGTA